MELIDILTPEGVNTGRSAPRNVIHSNGLWHKSVHVWIRNHAGELLLQQRSPTKETFPGLLDISAAGHISAGNTSRDTAVREIHEELGILVEDKVLKYLFTMKCSYCSPDNAIKDNEITDVYLMIVPVDLEEITPDPDEVSGLSFFEVNTLKNMIITKSDLMVPHEEEYRRLFKEINAITN